jgi:hypothetical protein
MLADSRNCATVSFSRERERERERVVIPTRLSLAL